MEKKPAARIYGLLGYPVRHSFSPAMHNAAFKDRGINARYTLFEVRPEELEGFFKKGLPIQDIDGESFISNDIAGLNVTIPYKVKILDFVSLDKKSFFLRNVEAVNTIINDKGVWKGFNTDIPGFQKHLKEEFDPSGKKVAILGAGGAARAVAYALANSKADEITIFDIDQAKTNSVVGLIKNLFSGFKIYAADSIGKLNIRNKDLLVNATPIGMKESDPCLLTTEMLHKNLFVYDLIYNPAETRLLKLAREKDCKVLNGQGMLLYQGMLSFTHFTGVTAPKKIMHKALLEELKRNS